MSSSSSWRCGSPASGGGRSPSSASSPAVAPGSGAAASAPSSRDRTPSQTRHFAGVARSVTILGAAGTEWLSVHVRRDAADSPDGKLTTRATEFATLLLDGSLATRDAGEWIRTHVCE